MKKSDVYMYLHCDEWNSIKSMNPCHDNVVYRGIAGRKALWRTIKKDVENEVIEVQGNLPKIRLKILIGDDPTEVNDEITYGHIIRLEEAK